MSPKYLILYSVCVQTSLSGKMRQGRLICFRREEEGGGVKSLSLFWVLHFVPQTPPTPLARKYRITKRCRALQARGGVRRGHPRQDRGRRPQGDAGRHRRGRGMQGAVFIVISDSRYVGTFFFSFFHLYPLGQTHPVFASLDILFISASPPPCPPLFGTDLDLDLGSCGGKGCSLLSDAISLSFSPREGDKDV